MIYTPMTQKAMQIAYKAHHGQFDKSGCPYIFHPYHIAEQMTDEISVCVALLHDVLEDTEIGEEELMKDFPEEVLCPLRILNHRKEVPYMDYIRKIKTNPTALKVKLADIAHNMDETRLVSDDCVTEEKKAFWRKKYREAKAFLTEE